ncbi:SemiSWEET transporter [Ramlibacter alkalitolerans]|uniref:SemiSWEET family sugar transporter n=1 Tax=Ramlibacter alkalitolerans TaxID=2039631 RepID=A0ABS1JTB4_9BURK|nr:SemiSWEET transporter [Ramlibacter alkalitolerans]MBL0427525.1 SemiSWEET family sugar transporter [Ramlibacter alkalitolerans]
MQVSDVLGYLAATLTTVSFVPQAWRTFRTKDVSGISLKMYTLFTLGVAVWLAYGIVLGEVPMMIANSTTLLLAIPVLVMRIKYGRKQRKTPAPGPQQGRREDKSRMARA